MRTLLNATGALIAGSVLLVRQWVARTDDFDYVGLHRQMRGHLSTSQERVLFDATAKAERYAIDRATHSAGPDAKLPHRIRGAAYTESVDRWAAAT